MEGQIIQDGDEYSARLHKVKELSVRGINPYAGKFSRSHKLADVKNAPVDSKVSVCGRLISRRIMGGLIFAHIFDIDGTIQIAISKKESPEAFESFKKNTDTGDFIGVSGTLFITKAGELTVRTNTLELLSKALRPLPEKFHGLSDTDIRYRQRYLDLISNKETRDAFRTRIKTLASIKKFLIDNDFTEVETPILQDVACGAAARPFVTHHNVLNKDFYLRIAPELFLKEVIAGGFDRVFELGKVFRNEGMDASHLQEFTMLEWYASYWDYRDNIDFVKKLFTFVINDVKGSLKVSYQGQIFDFSSIGELDYTQQVGKVLGTDILNIKSVEDITKKLNSLKMFPKDELDKLKSIPAAIDFVFKKKIRPFIIQPTVTYNYPAYMIPLARRNDKNEKLIDMFQVIVNGWEIVKAYSELVNPITQREAFEEQAKNKSAGDDEAMDVDENFLLAMEHGMPPMSGLGLGIDRFISILADQPTLRDVVLFPQMKDEKR